LDQCDNVSILQEISVADIDRALAAFGKENGYEFPFKKPSKKAKKAR
jgi:hypothetical protein